MLPRYIGITDVPTAVAARRFGDCMPNWVDAKVMIGVMMSEKTLNQKPTKWAKVFPPKESIAEIFTDHARVLNTLHYADYDGVSKVQDLLRAVSYSGPHLHALQLDMIWPDAKLVFEFKEHHPNIGIVLQVSKVAMKRLPNIGAVFRKILDYGDSIDTILIDMSMGTGKPMSTKLMRERVSILSSAFPALGIAVAGGLGPFTLNLVEPLLADRHPIISVDAQGRLRPSGNSKDPLDLEIAEEYLLRAKDLFFRYSF